MRPRASSICVARAAVFLATPISSARRRTPTRATNTSSPSQMHRKAMTSSALHATGPSSRRSGAEPGPNATVAGWVTPRPERRLTLAQAPRASPHGRRAQAASVPSEEPASTYRSGSPEGLRCRPTPRSDVRGCTPTSGRCEGPARPLQRSAVAAPRERRRPYRTCPSRTSYTCAIRATTRPLHCAEHDPDGAVQDGTRRYRAALDRRSLMTQFTCRIGCDTAWNRPSPSLWRVEHACQVPPHLVLVDRSSSAVTPRRTAGRGDRRRDGRLRCAPAYTCREPWRRSCPGARRRSWRPRRCRSSWSRPGGAGCTA